MGKSLRKMSRVFQNAGNVVELGISKWNVPISSKKLNSILQKLMMQRIWVSMGNSTTKMLQKEVDLPNPLNPTPNKSIKEEI
jgi:ubiquinone/menaquinone biosynthesis C-methylase UbiE